MASSQGEPDIREQQLIKFQLLHFFTNVGQWTDIEGTLTKAGFGRPHHRILFITSRTPGMTVNELCAALHVTHQNLRLPMKKLLSEGYLVMQDDESDRRRKLVFATPKGRAFSAKVIKLHKARVERAIATFGSEAFAEFLKIHEALLDAPDADWMRRVTR